MNIFKKNVGVYGSNSYIISNDAGDAIIIDVGGSADDLYAYIKEHNLNLKAILLTHGHFDHVLGVNALRKLTGAPSYISKDDLEMTQKTEFMLNDKMRNYIDEPINIDHTIDEEGTLKFGDIEVNVIKTPGHTKGGLTYQIEDGLFVGDTIFFHSVGRSDLYGGNEAELIDSVNRVLALEGNYTIYPGHSMNTSSDEERANNPYVNAKRS